MADFEKMRDAVDGWRRAAAGILRRDPARGSGRPGPMPTFASRVEHTLLNIDATREALDTLCVEAQVHGFRSVCVMPKDVAHCKTVLNGTAVLIVTVIDFPLAGSVAPVVKLECARAVGDGADELDMVVPLRALMNGDLPAVSRRVSDLVAVAEGKAVKVILETGYLSPKQIVWGAVAAEAGGARYVKTSTGYGPRGASEEDVALMRAAVGDRLGIKASGGIRERAFADRLIEAGADLLGSSSGPALV
jgi:deoxyribose-phosphate aldolase